jgi:hypothetical protein
MLFIDFYNSVLNTSFTYDDLPFPVQTIQVTSSDAAILCGAAFYREGALIPTLL